MIRLTDPQEQAPTKRELIIAGLASLVCIIALVAMGEDQAATTATSVDPLVTCTEDMACWDCQTMGNLICGEEVAP